MTDAARATRARGRARRELLLEATVDVIAERGIAGVTHRAVAAEASVPLSSTTYFFDSLESMIGQAIAHAMDAEFVRLQEFRALLGSGDLALEDAIDAFVDLVRGQSDERTIAQFEMYLFASRRPGLQPVVDRIRDETRAIARETLRGRGIVDERAAEAVVSLIDGFALHRIAGAGADRYDALAAGLHALVAGFGEPSHDRHQ